VLDLSGRVALVTGAGQSVGAGIARVLAAQGAVVGVNDVVASRAQQVAEEIDEAGGRAVPAVFDVTDVRAVADGVRGLEAAIGPVDVLVNNAGVPPGMGLAPFRAMEPSEWARFVDLNLYGVLHCTKAVIDGMCERGFGRIVTISSGAGQVGLGIGVSLYAAGKGGAISFMRHLAIEVARSGVTANTLALGLMQNQQMTDQSSVAALAKIVPVGRLGTPEDVGAAVAFLASDEAGWLTGQTIGLNGGSTTS
jgi:NAD(P)-dependent dehydrogenase (short-subunit alcohol dehydrogenase family)